MIRSLIVVSEFFKEEKEEVSQEETRQHASLLERLVINYLKFVNVF